MKPIAKQTTKSASILASLTVFTAVLAATIAGCQPLSGPTTTDHYPPSGATVCNPFGNTGSTGALGPQQGLIANLAYLANPDTPYSSVFDFEKKAVQVSTPVYLSDLDVPTEYFEQGFTSGNGTQLTTLSGKPLVQYFSLHIQSVIQLGPNDADGDYQLAIASDDGSVVSIDDGNGFRTLIDNDGDHPTELGCAESTIHLDHTMSLPITVDYYQGPPYNIALILLWRKVGPNTQWTTSSQWGLDIPKSLNDPYCGQSGNNLFFNWSEQPGSVSTPNSNWLNLLARGWSVVPAEDYFLPSGTPNNPCNTGGQCFTDTFTQPGQAAVSSTDLLFVTDTTPNEYDRADVAQALHDFSSQLPQGSDFQVGVMLGQGDSSQWHGRLWHAPNVNPVLSSKSLSVSDMQSLLGQDLGELPNDSYDHQGSLGLYSLSTSMDGSILTENESEGFYRAAAGLGVVFLADGPDQCAVNPSAYPECSGITPASVLAQLQALKSGEQGEKPLSVDAIVHTNHCSSATNSDAYGAGYLDIVQLAGGLSFNLNQNDCFDNGSVYAQAMQQIGQAMAAQMRASAGSGSGSGSGPGGLLDDFTLSHSGVNPSTLSVNVDGSSTQYTYNNADNQVFVQDPGTYGSVVQVNYCLAPAPSSSPSPTPSPSVSVAPSPSPTPSPKPSPSPSVSIAPSPSPTPSPKPSPSVSIAPSPSPTPSPSASPTPSPTPSPSISVAPSPSPTPSPSASPTPSPSPSCTGPFCGGGVLGQ